MDKPFLGGASRFQGDAVAEQDWGGALSHTERSRDKKAVFDYWARNYRFSRTILIVFQLAVLSFVAIRYAEGKCDVLSAAAGRY